MSLNVSISGYGLLQDPHNRFPDIFVFVLNVQQPQSVASISTWTVYRRLEMFEQLSQSIASEFPQLRLPPCPIMHAASAMNLGNLHGIERCRDDLQRWLAHLLSYPYQNSLLQSHAFVNFISAEANTVPQGLLLSQHFFPNQAGGLPAAPAPSASADHNIGEMDMDFMFAGGDDASKDDDQFQFDHMPPPSPANGTLDTSNFDMQPAEGKVALDDFHLIKVIGKGSFGKVLLVRKKDNGVVYAMKVLRKENIIKRNQVEHTRTERHVLGYVRHPFIVGLNYAFQTSEKLYFVLDYCAGGELFFHLGKVQRFKEPRAQFYAAEITLAIEYVHNLDIIYRDLKPENVLLDENGHIRLTDFGLSKEGIQDDFSGANSFCGTPEYLAPEILNRAGHGRAVDWWSLGALLYEMLTGLPPFYCRDRDKLFEKIRQGELTFPKYLSPAAVDLLARLLERDPTKRLGTGPTDAGEIKSHPFFKEIQWDLLALGQVPVPWKPTFNGALDTSQFDREFTDMPINSPDTRSTYGSSVGRRQLFRDTEGLFQGFTYTDDDSYMEFANRGPLPPSHF
ncbi:AGC protein kinase [Saprolegnia parasitica CBS 223.65]|uniref:non-specific serine/threonine protein kinase n=1 Tax=Saprolegnia parasitica (strain CBS 223.65) TaxID=695850 RepID=A0A067BUU9_SAPPC|nr:AGC protein kinase [Saprolegnia parasitica CBS 223.65]KDO22279.1 AGC protein kinase [Saprolegnia parasitica CBS 223.65]|eukprot:XP_012207014.1 AGC protein kinase [Saprolegnia parasitica CBS 223.65]